MLLTICPYQCMAIIACCLLSSIIVTFWVLHTNKNPWNLCFIQTLSSWVRLKNCLLSSSSSCAWSSAGHMILQAFDLIVWVISVSWCLTIDWFGRTMSETHKWRGLFELKNLAMNPWKLVVNFHNLVIFFFRKWKKNKKNLWSLGILRKFSKLKKSG